MASSGEVAVNVSVAPSTCAPGGRPSRSKVKRRVPAPPPLASGSGSAQSGCRPFGKKIDRRSRGRCDLDHDPLARAAPFAARRANGEAAGGAAGAERRAARNARFRCNERRLFGAALARQREVKLGFDRHAQVTAHCIAELQVERGRLGGVVRKDAQRQHDVAVIADRVAARAVRETASAPATARSPISRSRSRRNRASAARRNHRDSANRSSSQRRAGFRCRPAATPRRPTAARRRR